MLQILMLHYADYNITTQHRAAVRCRHGERVADRAY